MRYYFDLIDSGQRTDLGGIELASDAAARQEAQLRALNGQVPYQMSPGRYREIRVRDETGRPVCSVPIKP